MENLNFAKIVDAPIKAGTRVLIRVDYNVPLAVDGSISDDKRIVDSLPTVRYCLERGAKVVLCSHFGRPDTVIQSHNILYSQLIYICKNC